MRSADMPYIVLTGSDSCVILELNEGRAPIWRHWGAKLPTDCLPPTPLAASRPRPSFSLDDDIALSVFPTFGVGWFGAPALSAHRAGEDFTQDFTTCTVTWLRPDSAILFSLTDAVAQIQIDITFDLDCKTDVLSISTTLTNLGNQPLDVQHLSSACLQLPANSTCVRSYTGRHNNEFVLVEDRLSATTWLRENRRGLTSHDCVPAGIVMTERTSQNTGPTYGAQLAWSGNHCQRIEAVGDSRYVWHMGEWLAPGEVRLAPGETHIAPQVLATFSHSGLDGIAHNFHAALRARMTWPTGAMKPRPVHFNTWEGVYFDLKDDALMDMAERAAALGVERFVLDDGWFQGRRHDGAGLGDWWVDIGVFPNGLLPLAQHVTGLGMEFGLWVEPEMVNPDSDLFRAHPDWALQIKGRPLLTARNQLVLDLTKPAVFDYLLDHLGKLLIALPISYLKWDHNRDLTTAGSGARAAYRQQTLAAYALFDAIRAGWPQVEIEACAGGGGRIDAGILTRTHRVWTSDCIDAVSRVSIQRGFLQFFPPEIMGSHIGTSPAHSTGRNQNMAFRGAVALGGHFGIELDPRHLSTADQSRVRKWIELYKTHRGVLHGGHVWQGDAGDGVSWVAQGSKQDFVLSVFRCEPTQLRWPPCLTLPFIDQTLAYRSELVHAPLQFGVHDGAGLEDLLTGKRTLHGAWLAQAGLPLPALKGDSALIVRLRAQI
jgi:alpha-galactosidase